MSKSNGTIRSFSQLVAVAEDGDLNTDLDTALTDLLATLEDAAVSRNGNANGPVTLTIDLATEGGVINMATNYAAKKPVIARARSVFWVTPENKLSRRNPRQHELALRDVIEDARNRTSVPFMRGAPEA